MGELPSQSYTLFDIPRPQMTFVHVHPGAEELGRVYSPHLAHPCYADGLRRRARVS
jgi:acetolactate synthase-1/2/3 large subunit